MKKSLFFSASAALLFAACSTATEEVVVEQATAPAKASISGAVSSSSASFSPSTRVIWGTAAWQADDQIGVFMEDEEGFTYKPYITYDGEKQFDPVDDAFVLTDNSSTFRAYYPIQAGLSISNPNFVVANWNVAKDQRSSIDLLTATPIDGISKTNPDVDFQFYHRFTKVTINLSTEAGSGLILAGASISAKFFNYRYTYNVLTNTGVRSGSNLGDIAFQSTGKANQYEVILCPGLSHTARNFEITLASGDTFTWNSLPVFASGNNYVYNIKLTPGETEVNPNITGTINDWNNVIGDDVVIKAN